MSCRRLPFAVVLTVLFCLTVPTLSQGMCATLSVPFRGWWKPLAFRRREDLSKSPEGTRPPPTEVGGLRMKRAHEVDFQSTRPRKVKS